jgi:PPK2 family polyphosphate:nucleotide phosphotransferase
LDKKEIKEQTEELLKKIGDLQYKMLAEGKHSLLIVLQGIDGSGKDGLVRDLFKYCNPVSIAVKSFKKPTPEEYAHDFLWRVHQHTPAKGWVQVFIRSHYEDILVPEVEGFIPPDIVAQRYEHINNWEKLIQHNGTTILKFFMNVSPEEQEERLRERIENPEKHWKHNDGDWETRKKFDLYMDVYKSIFEKCNTVPWTVVPCDANWQKLWVVSKTILETLENMNLEWPPLKSEVFTK